MPEIFKEEGRISDGMKRSIAMLHEQWLEINRQVDVRGPTQALLGISKRGNTYIRTLLIHGSRCMLRLFSNPATAIGRWVTALKGRTHANVAAVALANKQAKTAWAAADPGNLLRSQAGTLIARQLHEVCGQRED